jgi:uncharacterized membrane protein YfcA
MSVQTIALLLMIGLAAGVLSGLVGVGGGIIIVPALVYFMGFDQHEAQGASLGLLLLPIGILAVLNYYKKGYIDLKVVAVMSVAFVLGAYLGSRISLNLPQDKLKKVFAIVIMILAAKMLFFEKK